MIWIWLSIILFFACFNDWPWLIVLVGVDWVLRWSHLPTSSWSIVVEMGLVFTAEITLAALRPQRRLQPVTQGMALEGAALGVYTLLWGTLPGLLAWQASLGFDATSRMHTLMTTAGRRALLRSSRVAFGILLLILFHTRVWS